MISLTQEQKKSLSAIAQEAEQRREEIEKARCLPSDLMQAVREMGIIRLWTAKAYGGAQQNIYSLLEAIESSAYYNGSLGWVICVTGTASLGSGYLSSQSAKEIFGDTHSQTGGWAAPAGRAKKVEGGIVVSGKWSWGSGISHCSHIVGGCLLMPEGEGRPRSVLAYFDPKDVEFIDNWQVLGLQGSNSIDYTVRDLFVPDAHWIDFPVSQPVIDETLYHFSFLGALASGVASVGLGLGQRALDEIVNLSKSKKPNGAARTLAERPVVHVKLAKMKARLQSARLLLHDAVRANWEDAENRSPNKTNRSELRVAASFAATTACEVVEEAYKLGGGSTVWDGVKLQELLRDVYMVTQHGLVTEGMFEVGGRVVFDLPVNERLL
ncbi:MAG: acyl-CoA dehydrogenase family protein [Bacteroidota bacterium]